MPLKSLFCFICSEKYQYHPQKHHGAGQGRPYLCAVIGGEL